TAAARVLAEVPRTVGLRADLGNELASAAGRMEPAEAAQFCGRTARMFADALQTTYPALNYDAWVGLRAIVVWMDPAEAARLLSDMLAHPGVTPALCYDLAVDLVKVARRLPPAESAKLCTETSRTLAGMFPRAADPTVHANLAAGIAAVATRMEPAQ